MKVYGRLRKQCRCYLTARLIILACTWRISLKLFWIVWNVLWGEKSSFSSRFFSQIAPLSSLEEAVETEVFHSQTFKQTIQNSFFKSGELEEGSVTEKISATAADGKMYMTKFYNLDAIISVGYRVNSIRATQFRQWCTNVLRQFTIRGYVLDKKRMENGTFIGEDYFEHLLAEIREIRLSERRFGTPRSISSKPTSAAPNSSLSLRVSEGHCLSSSLEFVAFRLYFGGLRKGLRYQNSKSFCQKLYKISGHLQTSVA